MAAPPTLGRRLAGVFWAPPAVFLFHFFAARHFGHEPQVDSLSHFLGGAAMAHCLDRLPRLAPGILGRPAHPVRRLAVIGGATIVALVWELAELAADVFLGMRIQTSAANTLRDLALGLAGATAVGLLWPDHEVP